MKPRTAPRDANKRPKAQQISLRDRCNFGTRTGDKRAGGRHFWHQPPSRSANTACHDATRIRYPAFDFISSSTTISSDAIRRKRELGCQQYSIFGAPHMFYALQSRSGEYGGSHDDDDDDCCGIAGKEMEKVSQCERYVRNNATRREVTQNYL
ncbi:hypothetical protein J6590_066455 [Homalodisca vitripennis]|nr:hypothetical protein J6590_066455 [Homalodisca vitripennis]